MKGNDEGDDGIEVRVRHYAHFICDDEWPQRWSVLIAADAPGHAREYIIIGADLARVDGGDPGDEDDAK